MKKFIINILLVSGLFALSSCDFDEFLDNPNEVTLESTDIDFLLNRIQTDFAIFYRSTSDRGARVTRIWHQASDTYEISHQAVNQNGTWQRAYAHLLNDVQTLKGLAEDGGFRRHLGIAQTIEAYVLMVLVDQFGDVPYTAALNPSNFNPEVDDDQAVYEAAMGLLSEAKANLTAGVSLGSPSDLFYNGNYGRWVRLVNTLMLRYHLNLRLVDSGGSTSAIDALVAEDNFLQEGDDFLWRYGTSLADPVSIHPEYNDQFPNGGGRYQSTYFMWHLTEAKGFDDPRAKYYFYRQVGMNPTSESEARCVNEFLPAHYPFDMVWCMPGERGYWGRDHLDPQGIPPDDLGRTLFGVYPAGGTFDTDNPTPTSSANRGAGGAGIEPVMLAAYVHFMLAEYHLYLKNDPDAAKAAMLEGARAHIEFVRSWSLSTAEGSRIMDFQDDDAFDASLTQYLDKVSSDFDEASSESERMRVIALEYWISLFCNGNEAYNLYRRTGQPDNMQPGQIPNFGDFPRTFFYPADFVNLNSNARQKADHNVKVFWDTNPDGFID